MRYSTLPTRKQSKSADKNAEKNAENGLYSGEQSEAVLKYQQNENKDRKADAQRQRLDCAITLTAIAGEKKEAGKKAADHANQQEKDDELEHGRLPQNESRLCAERGCSARCAP